jgi:hypothetical protein
MTSDPNYGWPPAQGRSWGDRWRDGLASFWYEIGREVRRHAGDERLPAEIRTRVREFSQRALSRSSRVAAPVRPYPRRALRDRVETPLPPALVEQARAAAGAAGIALDGPVVAVDASIDSDVLTDAQAFLTGHGYSIVRVQPELSPLDVVVVARSRFTICGSVDLQHIACLAGTPSLLLNARDPFKGYPVRTDGLYTIRRVIDLDDGRVLTLSDLLTESHFRNLRNCGYRSNTAADIRQAVEEMHDGVSRGWRDSEGQARFRARVVEAGSDLAARVKYVAEWGPDTGFIGDGRLARFQAEYVEAAFPPSQSYGGPAVALAEAGRRPSVDEAQ